ncbi:MAG: hypothetical protein F7C32_03930 [Desulfurococcales archaeon]|nr:hypothetical protein [Desulfurococcales archaeon]
MDKLEELIKKAHDIETQAAYTYTFGLTRLKFFGHSGDELERSVHKIAVDTIIHKHIMKALFDAMVELEKMEQGMTGVEERAVETPELEKAHKELLKSFITKHLEIEKNMIETYKELAAAAEHPLVKSLAEKMAENEREHHEYLGKLLQQL